MPHVPIRILFLLAAAFWGLSALAQDIPPQGPQTGEQPTAQPEAAQASVDAPTASQVQERIAQVEANESLSDEEKQTLLTPLRTALASLQKRSDEQAQRQEFIDATTSAPGTLEQLRKELDQPVTPPKLEDYAQLPADQALEAINTALNEATARLTNAQADLENLEQAATTRATTLANAPAQLDQWQDELAELTNELAALPADPDDPAAVARRWQKQAEAAELAARIARLEAEVASYTARRDVLPLRQNLAQRKADSASRLIDRLEKAKTEAQSRKARQTQQQAQQQASRVSDPVLQQIAAQTSELSARRVGPRGTLERVESVRETRERAEAELKELQEAARSTAARVRAAGLTEIVGRSLRNELRDLPRIDPEARERLKASIDQAQLDRIDITDTIKELGDVDAAIERARDRLAGPDGEVSPEVETQITSILENYVETLNQLQQDYTNYYNQALQLDAAQNSIAETTKAFRTFIEERILWTRSVQGPAIPDPDDVAEGVVWLLGGEEATADDSHEPIGSQWLVALGDSWPPPFLVLPTILALFASLWARSRAKKGLKNIATKVRKFSTDSMSLTLRAIPLTIVMSLPLPIALILASIILRATGVEVAQAVGTALYEAGILAFVLEFVRHACRTDGLVDAHFRWRKDGIVDFRRLVFLLEASFIPVAVVARAYSHQPDFIINDAVGRLFFILAQLVLAGFTAWAFAPWLPFVKNYLDKHRSGVINRARWVWYPLMVASPIALAVLAGVGYYYTAAQLDERLHLTGWLVVAATIAYNLVLRWLFIERRRLLVKRAQQRREEEAAECAEKGGGEGEGIEVEAPPELDAAEVDSQTRRVLVAGVLALLIVGLYWLWSAQLPALRMLERVQLYPDVKVIDTETSTTTIAGLQEQPAAESSPQSGEAGDSSTSSTPNPLGLGSGSETAENEAIGAITLADVGAALLFFAVTWVLARNLPGLLEITILKRLPVDTGIRFAVTSILRYILVIIGVLLGFSAIGIGWGQVQFLAAALTFGLAFGLQEIFANFISGLIILVERPMRVGDTVTVHNMNGKVTRIRMRATTIQDWELREVIVPNKVFITEEFTNWTLSDPRIRVSIPVGVSYGSDVRLVERTLLEIGQSQPHVVTEPRVRSLFLGFGDSTLNFELRVYLESYDFFLECKSELHSRIAERFRELDIEIAFPQRDLNIRDIGPLADALHERARGGDGAADTTQGPEDRQ
ncbi:MAG: mechanosensitive ion channel domain-containing protein [Phycisphaerales bacterium JB060]